MFFDTLRWHLAAARRLFKTERRCSSRVRLSGALAIQSAAGDEMLTPMPPTRPKNTADHQKSGDRPGKAQTGERAHGGLQQQVEYEGEEDRDQYLAGDVQREEGHQDEYAEQKDGSKIRRQRHFVRRFGGIGEVLG